MALSPTARGVAQVIEATVTLPATNAGSVEAISIPAGTVVLGAGLELLGAPGDVDTYTVDIKVGSTVIADDVDLDAGSIGDQFFGNAAAALATAADTVDVVATVTGTPTAVSARVFAIVVDVNDMGAADEVTRDQLA
jgi:hypothetical protein